MNPLVSIIVPVYNVEAYIEDCLNSLINQTYQNIEILCIDDRSTDGSARLLLEFQKKDPRIRVISLNQNIGLGAARNLGIEECKGEFCCFVDSDDFIDLHFVASLLWTILREDADIAKCQIMRVSEAGRKSRTKHFKHKVGNYSTQHERLSLFIDWFGTTNSLIRTKFLLKNGIQFLEEKRLYEDFIFYLKAYYFAKKISFFDESTFYYYRNRRKSINSDRVLADKRIFDSFKVTCLLLDFCDEHNLLQDQKKTIIKRVFLTISSDFLRRETSLLFRLSLIFVGNRNYTKAKYLFIKRFTTLKVPKSIISRFDYSRLMKFLYSIVGKKDSAEYDLAKFFIHLRKRNDRSHFNSRLLRYKPLRLYSGKHQSLHLFFLNGKYEGIFEDEVFWGASMVERRGNPKKNMYLCEDGFITSIETWANTRKNNAFHFYCSFVLDDLAFHYSAKYSSRLEKMLNSGQKLDSAQKQRARDTMRKIVDNRISKYNFQPLTISRNLGNRSRKVLVVDQSHGDASVVNAGGDSNTFQAMLKAAIDENPFADIIVKVHPDAIVKGSRVGYYSKQILSVSPRVIFFDDCVNPISIIEHCQKVYVCSSSVGMEALICGKEVATFGVPFYAGWGLTDDRHDLFKSTNLKNRRQKVVSVEELFYRFYIDYTIYKIDEHELVDCSIEQVLDYVLLKREQYFRIKKN